MVVPFSIRYISDAYLDESNVGGLLTEALTANVETVLADETGLVGADAAVHNQTLARSLLPTPKPMMPRAPPSIHLITTALSLQLIPRTRLMY